MSGLRISLKNKAEIDKIRLHQLGKLYCISGSCTAPDIPDVTQMNLSEASVFLDDGRGVIAEFPNIKNGNDWIEVIFPRR